MNTRAKEKQYELRTEIPEVECWNLCDHSKHTIPTGCLITIDGVHDEKHMIVCVVNEKGEAPGLPLIDAEGQERTGYRFIVHNGALAWAAGIDMPGKNYDLIGDILAYETGEADAKTTKRLFEHLKESGVGAQLQGHYSSRM